MKREKEGMPSEPFGDDYLDVLVREMVRHYVFRKAESKSGSTWDKAKDNPGKKAKWEEAKRDAATGAFLAARSRTAQDFVDWFVGTLCSKGQFLAEGRFEVLAKALRDPTRVGQVRTLTMLALAAESYGSHKHNEENQA